VIHCVLVISLVLLLLAGISAASGDVNLNEFAYLSFGLAAFVAASLVTDWPR
jgi:hypothetical protein